MTQTETRTQYETDTDEYYSAGFRNFRVDPKEKDLTRTFYEEFKDLPLDTLETYDGVFLEPLANKNMSEIPWEIRAEYKAVQLAIQEHREKRRTGKMIFDKLVELDSGPLGIGANGEWN